MTKKFTVDYSNRDIMEKLDAIHQQTSKTNGVVKLHTKLIFGAYSFTLAVLLCAITML